MRLIATREYIARWFIAARHSMWLIGLSYLAVDELG